MREIEKRYERKILSIILILTLLFSCLVFPVQAVYTVRAVDDFETGNAGVVASGFYKSSDASGLFVASSENLYYNMLSLQNGMGYGGSTGLYLNSNIKHSSGNSRKVAVMTKGITLPEDGAAILEYKFRLPEKLPQYSGAIICLSGVTSAGEKCFDYINSTAYSDNASLNIYSEKICDTENISNGFKYIAGEWYTVVTKISANGNNRNVVTDVIDASGKLCLSATKTITNNITSGAATNLWPVYIIGGILPDDLKVVIDDVSLTEYTYSQNMSMENCSVTDGDTEVSCSPLFRMKFDRPVDKTSVSEVKLYKEGDKNAEVELISVDTSFDRICLMAQGLEGKTKYIFDFSGVTSENGASLNGTRTISFTTAESSDVVNCEDDFETGNAGVAASGFYKSSDASGLFVAPSENLYYTMLSLQKGMGYGGSTGLYLNSSVKHSSGNSRKVAVMTKGITLPEDGAAVLEYKFRLPEKLPQYSGAIICLSGVTSTGEKCFDYINSTAYSDNASLNIYSEKICDTENISNGFKYIAGEWYTVVTKISANGKSRNVTTDIIDDAGKLCLSASKIVTNNITQDGTTNLWPVYIIGGIIPDDLKVVIDDVSLTEYKYPMNISLTDCSVTEGEEEVSCSPSFTLKFNQPLSETAASTVKLYKADETRAEAELTSVETSLNRIILTAEGLDKDTKYTLDFSNVTSEKGAFLSGTQTVTFTTSDIGEPINCEDDFETGNAGVVASGFYKSSDASGLFVAPSENMYYNMLSLQKGMGYGGTTGLYLNSSVKHNSGNSRKVAVMTKGITLPEDGAAVLEYKFRLPEKLPQYSGAIICLSGVTSAGEKSFNYVNSTAYSDNASLNVYSEKICDTENTTNSFKYNADEWYTVVTKISANGKERNVITDVLDSSGKLCLSATKTVTNNITSGTATNLWPVYIIGEILPDDLKVVIDDVSLTEYRYPMNVSFADCSVKDGATEVSYTPSFTLKFNQPIAASAASKVKLYKADEKDTEAELTAIETSMNRISLAAEELDGGTKYILDFSDVTSENGSRLSGIKTISFTTTDRREFLYREDDFENVAAGTSGSEYTTSDALYTGTSKMKIAEGVGYEKSKAYVIDNDGEMTNLKTKAFEISAKEKLYIEYKFNIKSIVKSGSNNIYITANDENNESVSEENGIFSLRMDDNGCYIASGNGTKLHNSLQSNLWYTCIIAIGKNTQSGYLLDNYGKMIATENISLALGANVYSNIFAAGGNDVNVLFDDVKVYRLSSHELEIDKENSSIQNGDTDVLPGMPLTISFNQPLSMTFDNAEGSISLYKGNEKVSADIARIDGNTVRITPTEFLTGNTEYTIKINSAISPLSGNSNLCTDTINFKVKRMYPITAKTSDITVSPDGIMDSGTKTLTVTNSGQAVSGAVLAVAVYEKNALSKLLNLEIFTNQTINEGENTLTFTLTDDCENVGSVEVLLYESLSNMQSLMPAHRITR